MNILVRLMIILAETVRCAPQFLVRFFFRLPAGIIPAQFRLNGSTDARHLVHASIGGKQPEPDAAQKQIIEVNHPFCARRLAEFSPSINGSIDGFEVSSWGGK